MITSILFAVFVNARAEEGVITNSVPSEIEATGTFVFYLHGGIIQAEGIDAVSPIFGKYEYTGILSAFAKRGYTVISERRPRDTKTADYAEKVAGQVRELLGAGVPPEHIVVVGASMGAGIAIDASIQLKNRNVKFAVLGICLKSSWEHYLEHYSADAIDLYGDFFSIYEKSDSYGSCDGFIKGEPNASGYREIALNMGIGHGFLYKPYDEWFLPLVQWIDGEEIKADE